MIFDKYVLIEIKDMDCRLKFPFSWLIVGSSGCGKTTHVLNFLRYQAEMTNNPLCKNIIYFYNEWQDAFTSIKNENIVTSWQKGLPTLEMVKTAVINYTSSGGSIVVIDDFAHMINQDILEMFTVLSHHMNCCIILLSQFLFSKNPIHRMISLNSTYITVFKNPRDNQQIASLARQIRPNDFRYIMESYIEATKKPYSYLFFDNHQQTDDRIRVRSRILPSEAPMIAWISKKHLFKEGL